MSVHGCGVILANKVSFSRLLNWIGNKMNYLTSCFIQFLVILNLLPRVYLDKIFIIESSLFEGDAAFLCCFNCF